MGELSHRRIGGGSVDYVTGTISGSDSDSLTISAVAGKKNILIFRYIGSGVCTGGVYCIMSASYINGEGHSLGSNGPYSYDYGCSFSGTTIGIIPTSLNRNYKFYASATYNYIAW